MGFNSAFKGLIAVLFIVAVCKYWLFVSRK